MCVHGTGPDSKTGSRPRFLNSKKNVIKLETKRFKFWKNLTQNSYSKNPPHKFLNVKTGPKVLSKRKNRTTVILTFTHTMLPAPSSYWALFNTFISAWCGYWVQDGFLTYLRQVQTRYLKLKLPSNWYKVGITSGP